MTRSADSPPPARLSVRPVLVINGSDEMILLRPYLYTDGDYTNMVGNVGLFIGMKQGDALVTIGFDFSIPPWLFEPIDRVLTALRRIVGRRAESTNPPPDGGHE